MHTDEQTGERTEGQRGRHAGRRLDRQAHRHTGTHIGRCRQPGFGEAGRPAPRSDSMGQRWRHSRKDASVRKSQRISQADRWMRGHTNRKMRYRFRVTERQGNKLRRLRYTPLTAQGSRSVIFEVKNGAGLPYGPLGALKD